MSEKHKKLSYVLHLAATLQIWADGQKTSEAVEPTRQQIEAPGSKPNQAILRGGDLRKRVFG